MTELVTNPLNDRQLAFIGKLNDATFEMIEYYRLENYISDGKFLWNPPTWIYLLNVKKLGYKLEYKKPLNYRRPEVYITEEVEFFQDRYPLYVPLYKMSLCLIHSLSPRHNSRMARPEITTDFEPGYFTMELFSKINENLKIIRKEKLTLRIKIRKEKQ